MADLTVLCWLWQQPGGRTHYTARHVNIWADMVRRHLTIPHRLACVTDMPDGIDPRVSIITPPGDFDSVRIPTWTGGMPQCLRRIALFRPDAASIFGPRFVSMDIDCVVGGSLDPLFAVDNDFIMYRGTAANRPYNGSMLMLTAGARRRVYDSFSPERAALAGQRYVGSDQAWISDVLGLGEATWGHEHGVMWWGSRGVQDPVILFFPGNPKPWDVVTDDTDDWVIANYRGFGGGRCLVLGHQPSVWEDLAAVADQTFDAVIASPEVAVHWIGDLLHVANTDAIADRLVAMHGFDDVICCGRSERLAA